MVAVRRVVGPVGADGEWRVSAHAAGDEEGQGTVPTVMVSSRVRSRVVRENVGQGLNRWLLGTGSRNASTL